MATNIAPFSGPPDKNRLEKTALLQRSRELCQFLRRKCLPRLIAIRNDGIGAEVLHLW